MMDYKQDSLVILKHANSSFCGFLLKKLFKSEKIAAKILTDYLRIWMAL